MKRVFFLLTVLMLTVTGSNLAFAADSDTNEETHTLILRRIDMPKSGYDYYFEVETEQGQIEEGMNLVGLVDVKLDFFDEIDTLFAFDLDDIDMEFLDGRYGITSELLSSDDFESMEITYTLDEVLDYREYKKLKQGVTVTDEEIENDKIETRTKGYFDETLPANGKNHETDPESKDDNENLAYVTITKLLPKAYPDFRGVAVRVCEFPDGPAMTAWETITSTVGVTLAYRTFEPEVDGEYYLEIANLNDRDTDVAGRWNP